MSRITSSLGRPHGPGRPYRHAGGQGVVVPDMDAIPARRFDPLSAVRTPSDGEFDLLLAGTVFQDIIFTGLPHAPEPGTEIWSEGMGSCPGGVANQAIAAARLGLRTGWRPRSATTATATTTGRSWPGRNTWTSACRGASPAGTRPVTVSLSVQNDRSLVTHGHPAPVTSSELIGAPPAGARRHRRAGRGD